MIGIKNAKGRTRKIPGVKKIVVSQSKRTGSGADYYHVKVYLNDIESLVKVAKSKETRDDLSQATYRILVAGSDDHSFTLPEPEFPSFER